MSTQIIDDPNSTTSDMIKNLKGIGDQREKYAKYDEKAPSFKSDPATEESQEAIEEFFTFKKFMFDKIIVILIICLLAIFIMKSMEFM